MNAREIAEKLISCIESDNGARKGSFLARLKPGVRIRLLNELETGIDSMRAEGCEFTQEEIELMAMGEQGEAEETFKRFTAYAATQGVNQALNTIFDPEREMVIPRSR